MDLWAFTDHLIVDVNLIFDADSRCLSQPLDTVCDLTRSSLASELRSNLKVKHDGGGALRLAAPILVILYGRLESFYDLEHAFGDFITIDIDAAITQVALDLITCKLCQCSLESFVELLFEYLTKRSVVSLNSILDDLVLIWVTLENQAV